MNQVISNEQALDVVHSYGRVTKIVRDHTLVELAYKVSMINDRVGDIVVCGHHYNDLLRALIYKTHSGAINVSLAELAENNMQEEDIEKLFIELLDNIIEMTRNTRQNFAKVIDQVFEEMALSRDGGYKNIPLYETHIEELPLLLNEKSKTTQVSAYLKYFNNHIGVEIPAFVYKSDCNANFITKELKLTFFIDSKHENMHKKDLLREIGDAVSNKIISNLVNNSLQQ